MSDTDAIIVGDSRLAGFQRYSSPTDLQLKFVIRRGARVADLVEPTLEAVRAVRGANILIVKIACGINNFTEFVTHPNGRELTYAGVTGDHVYSELKELKREIKEIKPKALVGFVTVPTLSFAKNIESRIISNRLRESKYSTTEVAGLQTALDEQISILNIRLKFENSVHQAGHRKGCRTISWHRYITKLSKRKRSRTAKHSRTVVRNNFTKLYDGLHAVSELKQRWFHDLLHCITIERRYTTYDEAKTLHIVIEESSDSTSSSDTSSTSSEESVDSRTSRWDFKRRKTD